MKYMKSFIILMMGLLLVSCGDDGESEGGSDNSPSGKTYSQNVTLPAAETEQEVQLTDLTAEIETIIGAKEWLTVMKTNASSPTVKLIAKINEGEAERSCVVIITDKAGDIVYLTVKQTAGRKYTQYVTLPAAGVEKDVQLTDLTAEINSISGTKTWLSVSKNTGTQASVKLVTTDNESEAERSCVVTITDKTGDKVLLTVKQTAGRKYTQYVTLPAAGVEKDVQLTDLTTEIKSISGAQAWLTVTKINGMQASVKLVATDNETEAERSCVVTITDKVGDKVLLTVKQVACKTYSQSVTLPAVGAEKDVQLTGLTAEINSISGAQTWLTVTKNTGTQASVKLVATDNETEAERSCVVTITDKIGDKVLLTVKQPKTDAPIGHDFETDQPAYTPRKP